MIEEPNNNKDDPDPEYTKGYHAGLYQGYNIALEDFKAGLRSVWIKDENGNYKIKEKYHFVDQDEASLSGAEFKSGDKTYKFTPEQIQNFQNRVNELLHNYYTNNPNEQGKFHPHVFMIAPGAQTKNWGMIKRFKIVGLKSPFGISDSIPEDQIIFFVDFDP